MHASPEGASACVMRVWKSFYRPAAHTFGVIQNGLTMEHSLLDFGEMSAVAVWACVGLAQMISMIQV